MPNNLVSYSLSLKDAPFTSIVFLLGCTVCKPNVSGG